MIKFHNSIDTENLVSKEDKIFLFNKRIVIIKLVCICTIIAALFTFFVLTSDILKYNEIEKVIIFYSILFFSRFPSNKRVSIFYAALQSI